jgi:nitroreductase/NAD-dependent dihydropyrimidine dehydrogenase PreA subunit
MNEIFINQDACSGCNVCVSACIYQVLEQNPDTQKARVRDGAARNCGHCGQCEAICPTGSISIDYPGAGPVPSINGSIPSEGEFCSLITMRRSIRDYQNKVIPKETFEKIFDIIRYAPTGMNGQSVRWHVMQDPADVRALSGKIIDWARELLEKEPEHILAPVLPMFINAYEQGSDKICHSAPHLVFAYSHKDNPIGFIDAVIAMTHLDLAAPVFGLGTCWAGIVERALITSPALMKSIGIPDDHVTHCAMMIGYPKYRFQRIPKRDAVKITWK